MRTFMKKHFSLVPFAVVLIFSFVWLLFFSEGVWNRLLITSDQLGYKQYMKKEYVQAAKNFENISFRAASFYKAGDFKNAKAVYQNLSSKESKYNLGNSSVMLGLYDPAIKAYELALKMDPNFKEAKENLSLAKARKILKEPGNDGEEGVGKLGADEIVFDNKEGKGVDDDSSAQKEEASGNANWLDRLQTGPKDFLKNKFRYQCDMQGRNNEK